jgi:CrcB protein
MKALFLVAAGGAIGSVLRYLVAVFMKNVYATEFPWHTFSVNIIGCFVIGIIFSMSLRDAAFEPVRLFVMVGILGGFTTYSSFGLETFDFLKQHKFVPALLYVLATNCLGLIAVYSGYALHKLLG